MVKVFEDFAGNGGCILDLEDKPGKYAVRKAILCVICCVFYFVLKNQVGSNQQYNK